MLTPSSMPFAELVTMATSLRGDLRASTGDFALTIPS
jgi:hypothetical protein